MIIAAMIISGKGHYVVWSCAKLAYTLDGDVDLVAAYPACASFADGSNVNQVAAVLADMNGASGANVGAAINTGSGMAMWLATSIHAIGVEIYVSWFVRIPSDVIANMCTAASYSERS